jgi:hypothetical protein
MHVTKFFEGTNLFTYDDWTPEQFKNYILEDTRQPVTVPILGDLTNPAKRWSVPSDGHVVAIAPDGDLIAVTALSTEPGDANWNYLMVREGPLP